MHKHISKLLVLLAICTYLPLASAHAQLSKVCPQVKELGSNQYKNNSPIRAVFGNNGSPITRFALNPTIIFIYGNPAKLGSANVYDSKGNYLTAGIRLSCDAPGKRGSCNSRYKGSERAPNDTRSVRRKAVRNTGSPAIYWRVSSSLCIRVPDAGKCYNVQKRGFCDGRTVS
jgi:hypothetical protein